MRNIFQLLHPVNYLVTPQVCVVSPCGGPNHMLGTTNFGIVCVFKSAPIPADKY